MRRLVTADDGNIVSLDQKRRNVMKGRPNGKSAVKRDEGRRTEQEEARDAKRDKARGVARDKARDEERD